MSTRSGHSRRSGPMNRSRKSVGARRSDRSAHDPEAFGAKDVVKRRAELSVSVMDEETKRGSVRPGDEGARLLGDPGGIWIRGDAGEVHLARGDPDEQEGLHTPEEYGSTATKSQAKMPAAWALRISLQARSVRLGARCAPPEGSTIRCWAQSRSRGA